jgi:uncharacterized protein involved in copper resistance
MNITKTLLKIGLFSFAALGVVALFNPITTGVLAAVFAGAAIGTLASELSTPAEKASPIEVPPHTHAEPHTTHNAHSAAKEMDSPHQEASSTKWRDHVEGEYIDHSEIVRSV